MTRQHTSRPGWARTVIAAVAALTAISAATSSAAAGASAPAAADELRPRVELISATLEGRPANDVRSASASVDGCRILFSTETQVLVPGAPQSDDKDAVYIRGRDSNRTRLVSSDSAGVPGKGSYGGIISGNGRYISMVSDSSNLTPPGTDSNRWLLRKDLRTGRLETARMPNGTGPAAGLPVMGIDMRGITADGRLTIGSVWYQPADHGPGYMRIAVYDWVTRRWTMLNSYGFYRVVKSISADGRYIAYFAANSSDGSRELYLLDRTTGTTRHVPRGPAGQGAGENLTLLSGDGKLIFTNWYLPATDRLGVLVQRTSDLSVVNWLHGPWVGGVSAVSYTGRWALVTYGRTDGSGIVDVYRWDRLTGKRLLISVTRDGRPPAGNSFGVAITNDGATAIFSSHAGDIVPGDTPDDGWIDSNVDLFAATTPTSRPCT